MEEIPVAEIPSVGELQKALGLSIKESFKMGWMSALEETQLPSEHFGKVWTALADSVEPLMRCESCGEVHLKDGGAKFCDQCGMRMVPVRHRDLLIAADFEDCYALWRSGRNRTCGCDGEKCDSPKQAVEEGRFWCEHELWKRRPHRSAGEPSMDMRF